MSPWAIRLAVTDVEQAGEVAGRLYALSTAGSLVGTLLSALVLIPLVGTRRTFLSSRSRSPWWRCSGLRPVRRYALAPAAIIGLMALPVGTLKAQTDDGRVIYEADTEYQYARVIERADGSRALELNEGQAQHSIYEPDTVLTGRRTGTATWCSPFTALDRAAPRGWRSSATPRAPPRARTRSSSRDTRVDGVEIDPELSEIGREYFDMNNPNADLHHEDARPWLRRTDARFDVISVDAYRQPYIPFYLTTRGVLRAGARPAGARRRGDRERRATRRARTSSRRCSPRRWARCSRTSLRDPIEDTNTLIVASERAAVGGTPAAARRRACRSALRSTARRGRPARIGPPLAGGDVYTDDKAPVEWLIDKSIVDYAAD